MSPGRGVHWGIWRRWPFWLILVGCPLIRCVGTDNASAADLIRFLRCETDECRGKAAVWHYGEFRRQQLAAVALAKLGAAALPELEAALDSFETAREYRQTIGSNWLVIAYTQIKGLEALPRLRRIAVRAGTLFAKSDFDACSALALGLTSFVSSDNELANHDFGFGHPFEPRNALNQLILAWERDDRQWLEASLGPGAQAALRRLLRERNWAAMRAEYWGREKKSGSLAVGYRFSGTGRWREPPETLTGDRDSDPQAGEVRPEVETVFTDRAGKECGRGQIRFVKADTVGMKGPLEYRVDGPDLGWLLRTIASCAADRDPGRRQALGQSRD